MAKRHEDRKPGQRVQRGPGGGSRGGRSGANGGGDRGRDDRPQGGSGSGRPGPSRGRPSTGRPPAGRSAPDRPAGDRPAGDRRAGNRPAGNRPAPYRPPGGKPALGRKPDRSKRRAQGVVVTPAKAPSLAKDGKVRLNQFLAMSGVCSRRAADGLIAGGRVEVNGELVRELGVRVDPQHDDVRFDGNRIMPERPVYVLFNKPSGVVCTNARNEQKKRVIDCLPEVRGRLFTVGRLDVDSEGLILLTNDGSFALEMTHPRYGVPKLYAVVVQGRIEQSDIGRARGGVWLAEGPTAGMDVKVERTFKDSTYLKVTLREGKNREIRRVFAKLGHRVTSLKRIRIGGLSLHGLSKSGWRFVQPQEIQQLREVARSADQRAEDFGEN
ncbi:MAG: pseudouridine synthase [Planctomycetota bacterium]